MTWKICLLITISASFHTKCGKCVSTVIILISKRGFKLGCIGIAISVIFLLLTAFCGTSSFSYFPKCAGSFNYFTLHANLRYCNENVCLVKSMLYEIWEQLHWILRNTPCKDLQCRVLFNNTSIYFRNHNLKFNTQYLRKQNADTERADTYWLWIMKNNCQCHCWFKTKPKIFSFIGFYQSIGYMK